MNIWQLSWFSIILIIVACFAFVISYFVWRQRATPGSKTLALLMLSIAVWTLANALEIIAVNEGGKIFWAKISYFGIHSITPFYLLLSLQYSRAARWSRTSFKVAIWIIPVISIGLALTNNFHHLIWSHITWNPADASILIYHHGPWFWIATLYIYMCSSFLLLAIFSGQPSISQASTNGKLVPFSWQQSYP
jgi:hypothetical protein